MKLKDYQIPQYGLDGGEDLEQYSLKNFDLKAYQLSQQQPDPAPIAAPCEPSQLEQATDGPYPLPAAPEAPSPNQLHPSHAPDPVQTAPSPPALDSYDVQFGAHFTLQTVSYNPLTPAQAWKLPRWVVTMVGLFFGSAAVMALAFCVVLLRDPKAAPTAPLAVPTAAVATTPAASAQPASSAPTNKAPGDVARAPSAPVQAAVRHPVPATANLMHDNSALPHRIVVSRHPSVVRRQSYGARRVASKSPSSSDAPQETETASRRPPKDALDQLLSESTL